MNGAESLLTSLLQNDVDVCFANPGTSEMHFVAALDRVSGMRCVLGLFEGVVTGAADGYARMLDRPAVTLLHLGPGLANGLSNLHNAMRAQSPIVNIIGDHATFHRQLDAPLTSDIEGTARPFSHWVRTSESASALASDAAAAVAAARSAPGRVASLILPADAAWNEVSGVHSETNSASLISPPARPADMAIDAAAGILKGHGTSALILAGHATRQTPLEFAGMISAATGARLYSQTLTSRITRGAGRVAIDRIPYPIDQAIDLLKDVDNIILVGARAPVGFFAYPDKPGTLFHPGTRIHELVSIDGDIPYALEALADAVGAKKFAPAKAELDLPARPNGSISPDKIGQLLAATLPTEAIVIDESITTGRSFHSATRSSRPHDWILPTGGSIGFALPVATGAAIACADRKVVCLESDGSGMYMPQALWTHARESLDILTIIFANRKYQILRNEMQNVGVTEIGPKASGLLDIDDPVIDWVSLATTFGVDAQRVDTMEAFSSALDIGFATQGPYLIEVVF
ncbi:MAG: acetolactate synthase large subunit [Gammaproteobacteria bacterium]|nr:acetolactate synthase large subunit [Gammaproteobacteria bacterium]MCP4983407.1 acetolactate synthase large subunit [Gammaproteobacteria bacterium]